MNTRSRSLLLGSALVLAGSNGCMRAAASEGPAASTSNTPQLVVFITVDQLRGDMLDRYRADMRHGYARLMQGAWFVNGFQDHANTETAPGHASTMSGRFPRSTGIMSNSAGVGDRSFPLVVGVANELGASPLRFQGTTLFDWLRAKDSRARALSVSRKDRGAILPIGRAKEHVYWYSPSGNFTTSRYYRTALPDWVQAFNARRIPHSYAGKQWRLSRDPSSYPQPDTVPEENGGRSHFPFQLSTDTARATANFMGIPAMDSLTALFALEGLERLNLGRGPHTDVLAVSFSTTDAVGHAYGPDSREAHENQIRVDETLGWFIDSLYKIRDSSTILFALTADHGVQPIPDLARRRGEATGNQGLIVSLRDAVTAVRAGLRAAGGDTSAFIYDGELVGVNRELLARARLNADSLLDDFRTRALAVPGVARVDRVADVYRADFNADPIARRWSHQVTRDAGIDLVITLTRYSYWYRATATHGSPYDQDAHVPIIFYGPWAQPGRYTEMARTADIGATLAVITGARPLEPLDGVVLTSAIKR
ncbi:MAG TPA: alkaline phosphatase family protein [Gemmatimonadaceae bacterium]|nr:alkaline phosphatase family protein [Gemmatimonadaceae bacterium]